MPLEASLRCAGTEVQSSFGVFHDFFVQIKFLMSTRHKHPL